MLRKKGLLLTLVLVILIGGGLAAWYYQKQKNDAIKIDSAPKQELQKLKTIDAVKDSYDLIVVGTDPEGVSAAISGARNGLKTLLIDDKNREVLGGLMTVGWLNSLDMNWDRTKKTRPGQDPDYFNKGIFKEWYDQIEGHSFDVTTAANAFNKLVQAEANIDLYMDAASIEPAVKKADNHVIVEGITFTKPDGAKQTVSSKSVIDATQDANIAAAAGVSFTIGREDLGDESSRMAVTAVFRLKNVDDNVWAQIAKRLNGDNDSNTGVSQLSAWGYGKEMADYESLNKERAKMRGLNIGRQLDGTILINALQIFGIDGLNPDSIKEAYEIAEKEIPNVITFMKKFKEFKNVELDAVAPELYVRETRHMNGLYRLSVIDLLENRDQWDRIAFGSYPADIQRISPTDNGAVVIDPIKYAVPFRSIVPQEVEGILVVGRSASYDTLAHGSARVIPVGMAEGQSAGVAAKLAGDNKVTFQAMAESKPLIEEMQKLVNEQGMDLKPYSVEQQGYMKHKAYEGLKAAVYMGIAVGSYGNSAFNLDNPSNAQRMVNQLHNVKRMFGEHFAGNPAEAVSGMNEPAKQELTLEQATYSIATAIGLDVSKADAQSALENKGVLSAETIKGIANPKKLTDGDAFLMLKEVVETLAGKTFE